MEGPVKERLTGALILVALLVIVVPEMLSGPAQDGAARASQSAEAGPPLRTYSLQLDTANAARSQDQSTLSPKAVVETPAQLKASDKAPPVEATVPPTPEQAPAAPAVEPKPAAGQWWAQLGSFASRDNAERLTRELRAAGYSVNLARVAAGGKDLYRVRAGPEASREAAASLQARLAAAGHKSSLVAP